MTCLTISKPNPKTYSEDDFGISAFLPMNKGNQEGNKSALFNEVLYFTPAQIEVWLAKKVEAKVKLERSFVRWLVLDLLFDRQGGCCAVCREELRGISDFDLDHKCPLSRGGTNEVKNLQLLCVPCHRKKTKAER